MPAPGKRKVTFKRTVSIRHVPIFYDYDASEFNAIWYNGDEMELFTRKAIKLVSRMESIDANQKKRYCIRGLERHSRLESISKEKSRRAARQAVFQEQDRQRKKEQQKNSSDETIANAYRQITSSCQIWAQVMGQRDQKAVQAYLFQEEDEDDKTSSLQPPRSFEATVSKLPKCETKTGTSVMNAASAARPRRKNLSTPAA